MILEILTDVHKNHVNHFLFPPGQIHNEIGRISNQVKNKYLVPEGNDLYKILKINAYILKKQLVFKISIPLFKLDHFNIHKIIKVPSVHNNELWWINNTSEYLITSTNHKLFQFMSKLEFANCLNFQPDVVVCEQPQQWLTSQVSNFCAWNLFHKNVDDDCTMIHGKLENVFIQLNQNNWIFIIPNATRVTSVCDDSAFYDELQGEGIIELNQNCVLSIQNIQLEAHRIINDATHEIIVPRLNHSSLLEFHSNQLELSKHDFVHSNFTELKNMLSNIKEGSLYKLNHHDVHHYSITYVLVILFIIYAIYMSIKYRAIRGRIPNQSVRALPSVPSEPSVPIPAVRRISMPNLSGRENVEMQLYSSAN